MGLEPEIKIKEKPKWMPGKGGRLLNLAFMLTALTGLNSMFGIFTIGIDAGSIESSYIDGHLQTCHWTSLSAFLLGVAALLCCLIHYVRVVRNRSVPTKDKRRKKLFVTVMFSLYVIGYGFGAVGTGPCPEFRNEPAVPYHGNY